MKNLVYLIIVLFSFSLNAQDSTCESSEKDQIVELNTIEKCSINSPKKESDQKKRLYIKPKKHFLKKRIRVVRRKKKVITRESTSSVNLDHNNSLSEIALEKDWNKAKVIAKAVSEKANFIEDFVSFDAIEEIPLFGKCRNIDRGLAISCFNTEMSNHINNHFTYPEEAIENNIQGNIIVTFIIDSNGDVKDIQTNGGEDVKLLKKEATRIVSKLAKFVPGKHQGKVANVQYTIPMNFKL